MEPIIQVKNVGKKYTIGHFRGGYVALRDVFMTILKSPLKFVKKKVKDVAGIGTKEEFWALRNVNFNIQAGEVVGIIGRNGAGKSTLLKILTGITPPTTGEIIMHGRVASLLEVGTGFHPELSGRENIFLNGAILGMKKKEIAENFDSIVEFAEIEKFLDTPVKYYSSGMYVRLAFSVAAHMQPDILLVDEVLAVGDAEFQKKCLGKMEEVTTKQGRTILFVSHNLSAVKRLCKKTILIEKGEVKMFDMTEKVINYYLKNSDLNSINKYKSDPKKEAQVTKISILNKDGKYETRLPVNEEFSINIEYEVLRPAKNAVLSVMFYSDGEILLLSSESDKDAKLRDYIPGKYKTTVRVPAFLFNVGTFFFDTRFHRPNIELVDHKQNINFEIVDVDNNAQSIVFNGNHMGKIATILDYETEKIN
jgi:lipopolysaccharide transport system ATP-binding protein